jgi:hypothetical protein
MALRIQHHHPIILGWVVVHDFPETSFAAALTCINKAAEERPQFITSINAPARKRLGLMPYRTL